MLISKFEQVGLPEGGVGLLFGLFFAFSHINVLVIFQLFILLPHEFRLGVELLENALVVLIPSLLSPWSIRLREVVHLNFLLRIFDVQVEFLLFQTGLGLIAWFSQIRF